MHAFRTGRPLIIAAIAIAVTSAALAQEEAPPAEPPPPWASTVGVGLALTSGNTETENLNVSFGTKYDPQTRIVFKADALYLRASADGETQADKASAAARLEYAMSERTFTFAEVSYLRDPFKDIDHFVAPVAGFGHRLIRSETRNLTVDAAAGAQITGGAAESSTNAAVKAGENFEWALSPASKVTQKLTGIWNASDFGDALYHFDAALVTTLMTRLELKLAYVYDYKSRTPSPGVEKGDSALFAAVLLKF